MNQQYLRFLIQAKDEASRALHGVAGALRGVDKAAASTAVGTERAGRSVDGLSGKLRSLGSRAVSWGAAAGLAALTAAVTGGVWAGLRYNSTLEDTTMQLTTMLKSAGKAEALVGRVKKMAAATPFAFPELADAAKKFIAFGFGAGSIVKNLTMLGDIASGTGQPLGELVDIYGKIRLQGRLYADDLMQLNSRGIPITRLLARQFGVTESAIFGMVSAGKIGFPQIEKAFKQLTGRGGDFEGLMKRLSGTFSGRLGTFWDTLNMTLGTTTKPLFEWLESRGLPTLTTFLEKLNARIEKRGVLGAFDDMVPGFKDLRETAGDVYNHFMKDWPQVSSWWETNGPGIAALVSDVASAIALVGDKATRAEEFIDRHSKAYGKIKKAALYLKPPLADIVDKILATKRAVQAVKPWLEKLEAKYDSLKDSGKRMASALKTAWGGVGGAAKRMWDNVSKHFKDGYDTVTGWIDKVIVAVNSLLSKLHLPTISTGSSRRGGSGTVAKHKGDDGRSRSALGAGPLSAVLGLLSGPHVVMPGDARSGDPSSALGGAMNWFKGSMWNTIKSLIPAIGDVGFPMNAIPPFVLGKVREWASKLAFPGGVGGGSANVSGAGYSWAYDLARRFGLGVSSTYRPGAITAAGYPSDHGVYGRAADFAGSMGAMNTLWQFIKATAPSWKQAIYRHEMLNYGRLSYYAPSDHDGARIHVHAARATGDDSRRLGAMGGGITINVVVPGGTTIVGTAQQVGEVLAPHIARALGRREADKARGR